MKRIIYSLLATAVVFSSCQKENRNAALISQDVTTTDADYTFRRSTTGSNKNNNNGLGLTLDYDVTIKLISNSKYRLKIKLNGMKAAGYEFGNSKLINGVVWGVVTNISNNDGEAPLAITLTSMEKNGDTYVFPDFEYKGDLDYELLDISNSFRIKGGDLTVQDASTIKIAGSTIGVDNGNFKKGTDFTIKEGTTVVFNQEKMETNFAILFSAKEDECSLVDEGSFFLLPKGHTIEQAPRVAKVNFLNLNNGSDRIMRITVVGDPAESVASALYTPAPYPDPKNPDVMIQPAAIEFHRGEPSEKKIGICCYDNCITQLNSEITICGSTDHFKPSDFSSNGPGWARLSLKTEQ